MKFEEIASKFSIYLSSESKDSFIEILETSRSKLIQVSFFYITSKSSFSSKLSKISQENGAMFRRGIGLAALLARFFNDLLLISICNYMHIFTWKQSLIINLLFETSQITIQYCYLSQSMRRKTNVKRRPWGDMQKHCGRQMTSMGRCAKNFGRHMTSMGLNGYMATCCIISLS